MHNGEITVCRDACLQMPLGKLEKKVFDVQTASSVRGAIRDTISAADLSGSLVSATHPTMPCCSNTWFSAHVVENAWILMGV
jgi:hypothetical protein